MRQGERIGFVGEVNGWGYVWDSVRNAVSLTCSHGLSRMVSNTPRSLMEPQARPMALDHDQRGSYPRMYICMLHAKPSPTYTSYLPLPQPQALTAIQAMDYMDPELVPVGTTELLARTNTLSATPAGTSTAVGLLATIVAVKDVFGHAKVTSLSLPSWGYNGFASTVICAGTAVANGLQHVFQFAWHLNNDPKRVVTLSVAIIVTLAAWGTWSTYRDSKERKEPAEGMVVRKTSTATMKERNVSPPSRQATDSGTHGPKHARHLFPTPPMATSMATPASKSFSTLEAPPSTAIEPSFHQRPTANTGPRTGRISTPGFQTPFSKQMPTGLLGRNHYAELRTTAPENFATLQQIGLLDEDGTPTKKMLQDQRYRRFLSSPDVATS